jgi:hypothetical protein
VEKKKAHLKSCNGLTLAECQTVSLSHMRALVRAQPPKKRVRPQQGARTISEHQRAEEGIRKHKLLEKKNEEQRERKKEERAKRQRELVRRSIEDNIDPKQYASHISSTLQVVLYIYIYIYIYI